LNSTPTDNFADLDRLRLSSANVVSSTAISPTNRTSAPKLGTKKISGEFLRGPIPLPWLTAAAKLSGKGPLAVALALWFEAGRRNSTEVRLTTAILNRFNVNRKAKYRALASLEKAGLVRVHQEPRKNPVVTILNCPGEAQRAGIDQLVAGTSSPVVDQAGPLGKSNDRQD